MMSRMKSVQVEISSVNRMMNHLTPESADWLGLRYALQDAHWRIEAPQSQSVESEELLL